MNELHGIGKVLLEIIETPGAPFRLGVMIATASIIGFALFDQVKLVSKNIWKFVVAIVVFFIFQEWFRMLILSKIGNPITVRPVALVIVVVVFYAAGLGIGIFVAYNAKKKTAKSDKAAREVINGVIANNREKKSERPTLPRDLFFGKTELDQDISVSNIKESA